MAADLEISEVQLAAGDIVSGDAVMAELRASLARFKDKKSLLADKR